MLSERREKVTLWGHARGIWEESLEVFIKPRLHSVQNHGRVGFGTVKIEVL